MAKNLQQFVSDNFATGLNVVDSPHDMQISDIQVARNVIYRPTGEVESIDGLLKVGNSIYVNGLISTEILGGVKFNGTIYLMASNGVEARLVYKDSTLTGLITAFADSGGGLVQVTSAAHGRNDGDVITITGTTNYNGEYTVSSATTNTFEITAVWVSDDATGTWTSLGWTEVSSIDFAIDAQCDFQVYNDTLWFVNGRTTNSNVLHFVSTSNVLTGLTTACGLESGVNRITLHLDRMWISKGNSLFVSVQYPVASDSDWDASRAYSGSDTPGLIIIDDDTEDEIKYLISHFGQLVVFRDRTIHVVTGTVILTSTISKSFNSRGTLADFSVGRSDVALYFLSREGVKQFKGIATQDKTTEFDAISSIGIDRKIRSKTTVFTEPARARGYAFQDKYYLSDGETKIYVFDEITGGWSEWDIGGAEVFIEDGDNLFCARADAYYQINADSTADVSSEVRTKDFNLGTDQFYKLHEKVLVTLKTFPTSQDITLSWYLDGSEVASGTKSVTIEGAGLTWDSDIQWDSGLRWDSGSVSFLTDKQRKLGSSKTISFGMSADGSNRFSLSSIDLLFEILRREV